MIAVVCRWAAAMAWQTLRLMSPHCQYLGHPYGLQRYFYHSARWHCCRRHQSIPHDYRITVHCSGHCYWYWCRRRHRHSKTNNDARRTVFSSLSNKYLVWNRDRRNLRPNRRRCHRHRVLDALPSVALGVCGAFDAVVCGFLPLRLDCVCQHDRDCDGVDYG